MPACRSTILPCRCRRARAKSAAKRWLFPKSGYHGEYIREIAANFLAQGGDPADLGAVRRFAVAELRREQDEDLKAFGVRFDNYYLESSLYTEGKVEATVNALIASGKTYELDGALWLKTTDYGDDKDRVMRKSDGSHTYFVPDVAYHLTKWQRGFAHALNIQGSDHHGTVARVRAGLQAAELGNRRRHSQGLSALRPAQDGDGDERRRRSKAVEARRQLRHRARPDRRGRARCSALLPRFAQSRYRVRVRHRPGEVANRGQSGLLRSVCACAHLLGAGAMGRRPASCSPAASLAPLALARELDLAQRLGEFPEMLAEAGHDFAPHMVAFYLRELAGEFHSYYNAERILVADEELKLARLALILAVRQVLQNGLALLGVSAPEKM